MPAQIFNRKKRASEGKGGRDEGGKVSETIWRGSEGITAAPLENDRNPNCCYLPKPNILLKPNYSAKNRIAEYQIVHTQ